MWTDTITDSPRPAGGAREPSHAGYPPTYRPVPPELIAHYVARGRHLRAEALADMARRLAARVRWFFEPTPESEATGKAGPEDPLSVLASDLRSPLTAIRSSAEILRDNPDIDSVKRRRFVDVVLAEEARLEALVARMLDASNVERGSRVWQLELDKLRLGEPQGGRP